jgi:nucleoid DNA-binding protein
MKITKERLKEMIKEEMEEVYDDAYDIFDMDHKAASLRAEYGEPVNIEGFGYLEEDQAKKKLAQYLAIAAEEAEKWQKGEGNIDTVKTYMANSLAFWKALKDIN